MCIHERDDDAAAWHQAQQEKQQMMELALETLAKGEGGEREITLLAAFCNVRSPYERKSA